MSALTSPDDLVGLLSNTPAPLSTQLEKRAIEDRDHDERKQVAQERWEEEVLDQEPWEDAPIESLIDYVKQAFEDAKSTRTANCIDEQFIEGRRLIKGDYTREEKEKMPEILVWTHLVSTISIIALAFLRSVLSGDEDNPLWELEHSPIPELPEFIVRRAAQEAAARVQLEALSPDPQTGQPAPMTEQRARQITEELREEIFQIIDKQADINIRNLKREIADRLEIGDFYEALDEFLQYLVRDPIACMKGPIVASKDIPRWKDGKKIYEKRKYQHYETIDSAYLFPSSDSKDPQTGSYIIHLKKMTRRDLMDSSKLKGFIAENIDILLCEFEDRSRDWLNPIEEELESGLDRAGRWRDYEDVDVIEYHGRIPGFILHHAKIDQIDGKKVDPKDTYEMEIWMTCDQIIRAVPACHPDGRPFHCASLYPCPGSFWGESIPHRARDEQRSANAALRAAIRDLGYTSGPISQTDVSMLDDNQKIPRSLHAGMNVKVNSRKRGLQGKAVNIEQLTSQAAQFLGLVNIFFQNAELSTGFNRQMMGQAQPGISTLGEANILQSNATVALRSILVGIDKVIEKKVDMTACQIMMTTDDPGLKADARPVAKGSSHLLDRELAKNNLLQIINTLYPISLQSPGLLDPYAMGCMIREWGKANGIDPDKLVPDPALVEQRNMELLVSQSLSGQGAQGQGQQSLGTPGGVNQPPAVQNVNAAQESLTA